VLKLVYSTNLQKKVFVAIGMELSM
jgi:hypothetical protein